MLICRTCLSAESLSNIFEEFNYFQINSATGVVVQENDGLPQMICKSCKDLLTSAIQLRKQSLYAESVLLEELNSSIKLENMHRDESTDSDIAIEHFRQPKKVETRRKTMMKVNDKGVINFRNTDTTSSKRNMCKNKSANWGSKNVKPSASVVTQDGNRNFNIDIKVENISVTSDLQDRTVNVAQASNTKTSSNEKEELEKIYKIIDQAPNPKNSANINDNEDLVKMYKIIDQDLERSKNKYKSKINEKEVLRKDLYDDFVQEFAQAPNPKNSSKLSEEELEQNMYKIIDQELERSNTKYKSKINEKEVLQKDLYDDFLQEMAQAPNPKNSSNLNEEELEKNIYKIIDQELDRSKTKYKSKINEKEDLRNDLYDDFLQEIAQAPNLKDSSNQNEEELEQMYKIIDQELERSKTEYKSKINVKEFLKKDNILDLLSPDLKCLLADGSVDNSRKNLLISKHNTQSHNKAKLAKLWALAIKPVDRSKLVQCSVCNKLFKHNYFLRHASTHVEKEFTCEMCGSKFVHVHALRYHQQRRHGAARKHACAQCDYTAVHKEELLNHENRVHTGSRPFICDVCGDGFCQRRTLVQHMRKHYGVKRYKCEFCEKLFTSLSQLGAHRKQYHLLRYTFLCYVCPYRSTDRDTVRRHLLRAHGIARPLQQPLKLLKEKR